MGEDNLERRTDSMFFTKGDVSKYYGKYVACPSILNREIIAYGEDPIKVAEEASKKGIKFPLVSYFPFPDETWSLDAA